MRYSDLSLQQEKMLPELIKATPLPGRFTDSTHKIWDCETVSGPLMLKVCNSKSVSQSVFWQAMSQLFSVNLPQQLGKFEYVYKALSTLSPLTIPAFYAASSATENENAFIAVSKLPGEALLADAVTEDTVIVLSEHISSLHKQEHTNWGPLIQPEFEPPEWPKRFHASLLNMARARGDIPDAILAEALSLVKNCAAEVFVPMMPDLRWDQFLHQHTKLSALVDLDAFVCAPKELELVLLEYLLDDQQAQIFSRHYQQEHQLPDLLSIRKPYRLLLFLMNVLGEKNLETWMQAPTRF